MEKPKRIIVVAGEASGDLHAANLVRAIKTQRPEIEFFGLGGSNMRQAGVEIFFDLTRLSVVGFFEVIKHLKEIRKVFHLLLKKVDEIRPDAAILVDYPGFNLRLAKELKKKNIQVIYYISPQIWAWGLKRVELIKKTVDKIIVILKFEEGLYKKYGIDAAFVGHPLLELAKPTVDKERFLKAVGLALDKTTVALLPGSRQKEVERLLPVMLKSCRILHQQNPRIQFLLLEASTVDKTILRKHLKGVDFPLATVVNQTYNGLNAADAAMVASGTATLETAIMQVPMVVTYKVSFLTWLFIRQMIKIPYVGLVNVVAGRKIVPECLQYQARPRIIAEHIREILDRKEKLSSIKKALAKLKEELGEEGASERAAKIVVGLLN